MIINPRGTSGSGKSHFARQLIALYTPGGVQSFHKEGRKQPYYYRYDRLGGPSSPLFVLGHYETACGGCDTINGYDEMFALARKCAAEGDVLMEGLLLSAEANRSIALGREFGDDFQVLLLDTPLGQCIANIQARRAGRGNDKPVNPKNTESKYKGVKSVCRRLVESGVRVYEGDFDTCFARARAHLNV